MEKNCAGTRLIYDSRGVPHNILADIRPLMKLHKTLSPEGSLRLVSILVYFAISLRNHDPVKKTLPIK